MDNFILLIVETKLNAAIITTERIDAGHPENICLWDQQDWNVIVARCKNEDEVLEKFEQWTSRAQAWELRNQGRLN
jgi:hypothetical protein